MAGAPPVLNPKILNKKQTTFSSSPLIRNCQHSVLDRSAKTCLGRCLFSTWIFFGISGKVWYHRQHLISDLGVHTLGHLSRTGPNMLPFCALIPGTWITLHHAGHWFGEMEGKRDKWNQLDQLATDWVAPINHALFGFILSLISPLFICFTTLLS